MIRAIKINFFLYFCTPLKIGYKILKIYKSSINQENMKVYQTKEIRNVAIIEVTELETTLAEAMVSSRGVINRRGNVDDKTLFPTIEKLN